MLENLDLSGKTVIAKVNPETNELFTIGNNKEWCSVRVESSVLENDEGFWTMKTRVAKIRLQVELAETLEAKGLLKDGKELPVKGKIIIRESFEPFYEGQEPKMNPKTMSMICFMNQPVFRQSIFTSNMDDRDMFIKEYWIRTLPTTASKETVPFDKFMEEQFPEPELVYEEQLI